MKTCECGRQTRLKTGICAWCRDRWKQPCVFSGWKYLREWNATHPQLYTKSGWRNLGRRVIAAEERNPDYAVYGPGAPSGSNKYGRWDLYAIEKTVEMRKNEISRALV